MCRSCAYRKPLCRYNACYVQWHQGHCYSLTPATMLSEFAVATVLLAMLPCTRAALLGFPCGVVEPLHAEMNAGTNNASIVQHPRQVSATANAELHTATLPSTDLLTPRLTFGKSPSGFPLLKMMSICLRKGHSMMCCAMTVPFATPVNLSATLRQPTAPCPAGSRRLVPRERLYR